MRFALLLTIASLLPMPAKALSYTPQTPTTVARDSELIVIATVIELREVRTPQGATIERLTLQLHEVLRGAPISWIERSQVVKVLDGSTGAERELSGNPRCLKGRTYLFFLPPEEALPSVPLTVAGELGLFEARRLGRGWAFFTLAGARVLRVTAESLTTARPEGETPDPGLLLRWREVIETAR